MIGAEIAMSAGLLQRLDRLARNLTPFAISLVFVMVSVLPLEIPFYGAVTANLGVMAVFYWAVYRPDLLPPAAAFLLGLWQDMMFGTAFGMYALVFLIVHTVLAAQRRFFQGKSFLVVWWAFALVALLASILAWILAMLLHGAWLSPMPAAFQYLLTIALYPFATWLLARSQHAVLRQV